MDRIPVLEYHPRTAFSTGISYTVQIPGNVPSYEEHAVRRESGYKIPEWYKLEPGQRALEVALSRVNQAMELVKGDSQDEAIRNMKRKNKRGV